MRWLCVFSTVLVLASGNAMRVNAASTTNFTDQWWNPNESGWGAAGTQQGDTIFFNVFVFDAQRKQTSFTAAAVYQGATAQGHLIFSGDLYLVSGPPFSGPFNPATVSARKVGTLTFDADTVNTANLTYTVDGVAVIKSVTRQLWRFENFSGDYIAGFVEDTFDCADPANNGHSDNATTISFAHSANNSVSIVSGDASSTACNYAATYTQSGHMGAMQGTYNCTNGRVGTITLFELEKSVNGSSGRYEGTNSLCSFSGRLSGVRR